ncbi:MAG: hypothetical protein G01um101418_634 [Parcubacteria group bacterium Gr01-1014_18]|nr:MAG: hypothetical protein Greene041636_655 [Parcubacteria group bacterium Greene0416_36]TSC80715.1 MAG: hypothetical protein G01um101418_634 [Parcubacteria group bacterium Gr01-1014_18]TSC98674.1 MAG: hypothetical protein Greene101420_633 [Parcubacteria group bacterium Greene1014_20]TSD07166.1 MAG: hypothetical protein Greene07142_335 [Parcubacteria group bacterium Greene0714_2]
MPEAMPSAVGIISEQEKISDIRQKIGEISEPGQRPEPETGKVEFDLPCSEANAEELKEVVDLWMDAFAVYYGRKSDHKKRVEVERAWSKYHNTIIANPDGSAQSHLTHIVNNKAGEIVAFAASTIRYQKGEPPFVNIDSMGRRFARDSSGKITKKDKLGANLFSPILGSIESAVSGDFVDVDFDKKEVIVTGNMLPGSAKLFAPSPNDPKAVESKNTLLLKMKDKLEKDLAKEVLSLEFFVGNLPAHREKIEFLQEKYNLKDNLSFPKKISGGVKKIMGRIGEIPFFARVQFGQKE